MAFQTPRISTEDGGNQKFASVIFQKSENPLDFVNIRFVHAPNPNNTVAQEEANVIAIAKRMMSEACS